MAVANLPLIPGTFPTGYCWPASPQTYLNDLAEITTVQLDITGATIVINQTTTPAATDRDKLWRNPDTGHVLSWNSSTSKWEMRHPYDPASPVRLIWVGTTTQLLSFDGGDGAANPMWEVDATLDGRVPVGVGNLPGSGTAVAVGGTGGSDQATIAQANLPAVKVAVNTAIIGAAGVGTPENVVGTTYGSTALAGSGRVVDSTSSDFSGRYYTKGQTDDLGTGTALTTVSPYYGVYIVKRTSRTAYWS